MMEIREGNNPFAAEFSEGTQAKDHCGNLWWMKPLA